MQKEHIDSVKGTAAQAPQVNWTCVDKTVFDIADNPLGPYTLTQGLAYDPETNRVFSLGALRCLCSLKPDFQEGTLAMSKTLPGNFSFLQISPGMELTMWGALISSMEKYWRLSKINDMREKTI
ncbi:hypothetical protein [Pseudomonas gingeri]|uniref:hypothetical protein n=1 Tax=Pseudomonas gingeri TaxID=117681 RepID=UPI0015BBFF8C|nr:hypothetical protein [Pseudomonas gingeri]NWD46505.1 hypothetical protein [Pseudomonas gingeri]